MFSKKWEKTYKENKQISVWPWSDLITLVSRYVLNKKKIKNVLEIGSGAGANIRFFYEKKIDYYGIEGSKSAVKIIIKRFPKLRKNIYLGDFTKKIPFKNKFDLIIDRGSLTHVDHIHLENTLTNIKRSLKKNGYLICVDWFSKKDSSCKIKSSNKKNYKIANIKKGNLKNVGVTTFSSFENIKKLTKKWKLIYCEEKTKEVLLPKNKETRASFSFVLKNEKNN